MDLLRCFRELLTFLWKREQDDNTLPSSNVLASSLFTDPPRKVNDSLYELYNPEGTPNIQILFFHGLKFYVSLESHMWTTWQSGDRTCIWPQKWLAEEFPSAQIFLVSYDGSVRNDVQYSPDIYIVTENLTSDLLQGGIGQIPKCPVILVGHCCGGIVIKELCLRVSEMLSLSSFKSERAKLTNFLYNTKGIFYYSTPHRGVSMLDNEPIVENNPLLEYFQTMSKAAKRLNQEFGQLRKVHAKWRIHGVGTNIPTNLGRLGNIKVGFEESGRDGDIYNVIRGVDHYAICKPQDKKSRSYYALTNLVKTIADDQEVIHLCHDLPEFCPGLESLVQAVEDKLKTKITSRYQDILKHPKFIADSEIYDVDLLGDADAQKLFCYHAFGAENIPANMVENVERIVQKCQGLPLTLEVLGCYLRGCKDSDGDLEIWKETIDKLGEAEAVQGGEEDKVWARLRISYDKKLSQEEKEMFIAAATFFFGQPVERALAAWSTAYGSPHSSWKNLLSTCLVKVKARESKMSDGWSTYKSEMLEVWVHEHLRNLARKTSKAEVSPMMDGVDNTSFNMHSLTLRRCKNGLRVRRNSDFEDWFQLDLLDKMENLKYLEGEGSLIGSVNKFPRKLSLLSWEGGGWEGGGSNKDSRDLLPINLEELSDLAILELSEVKVLEEFSEALGSCKNLHTLSLDSVEEIHHLPTNFGKLSRLKRLKLTSLSIRTLPDSFGDLKALEYLHFDQSGLLELPESFGSLSLLKHLILSETSLKSLPKSFSKLLMLERLHIFSDSLKELGDSFGKLRALNFLEINCKQLKALPESFGQLSALRILNIYGSLERLLDSFARLSALEELKLVRCNHLKSLPDNFGELSALRRLMIGAKRLEKLPDSFGRLSALEELRLLDNSESGCEQLKTLPESFGDLLALRILHIGAKRLKKLPDKFGRLSTLEELQLNACEQLQRLPGDFGQLKALKTLNICMAGQLKVRRDNFRQLVALKSMFLSGVVALEVLNHIETLGNFSSLERLDISICPTLKTLPESVGHISSLRSVDLWSCPRIKNLPDSLGKPHLPQLAIPQQDSPVEGHAPKTTATEGVQLKVVDCPLLDASLQELGWVKSNDDHYVAVYQRK